MIRFLPGSGKLESIPESTRISRRNVLRTFGAGAIAGMALSKLGCLGVDRFVAPAKPAAGSSPSRSGYNETMLLFDTPLLLERTPEARTEVSPPQLARLVRATIGGHSTLLIIDTGATETILTRSLATSLGLHLEAAEPGVDHAGGHVTTWTTSESIHLNIASYTSLLGRVSIIDAPIKFDALGIGGILCPQRLHDDATVVLDFDSCRFQLVSGALATVVSPSHLRSITLDRATLSGDEAPLLVVEGVFPPSTPVRLMLNTGGYEAELAPWLLPGTLSESQVRGKGISGSPVQGTVLKDRELILHDVRVPIPEVIIRPQRAQMDGQLGMQILQGTHLLIHSRERSIRWSVPMHWPTEQPS